VPCARCRRAVDPLRAARVAIFHDKFRYFCSAECRSGYDPDAGRTPLPLPSRPSHRPDVAAIPPTEPVQTRNTTARALEDVESDGIGDIGAPSIATRDSDVPPGDDSLSPLDEVAPPPDVGALLIGTTIVAGVLSAALVLVGPSPVALSLRALLLFVAVASYVAHAFTSHGDPGDLHPTSASAAPVAVLVTALVARFTGHPIASEAIGFGGVLVASLAVITWLVERARQPIDIKRDSIRRSLAVEGHRIVAEDVTPTPADHLRPGEEIVVEKGEIVPVDATVIAGAASVHPWLGTTTTTSRGEGDPVVAGASVVEGRLRVIAGWASDDRAWMRLTHDPRRRADVHAPIAQLGRSIATKGSLIAAAIVALVAFSTDRDPLVVALFAAATHAAAANQAVARIAALEIAEAVLSALKRGVVFRTAEALDRAGRVSAAVFCARGTLLLGEPEVAGVEAFGDFAPDKVLALVSGTESGSSQPTGIAIQRAARNRGVRPDGVRSPAIQPGLGVTAVASSGQPLVVGSRGLMLRERISVALAERRMTDLEAMGRNVVLVALGGKLVGLVGFQDGLRPGARAAVQHLLDARIEPVLLSGDTRETCEALGRAVDIDHIRAEVLPQDRSEEIKRLSDGGATVAVLGRSPVDDAALSAADVSVALDSAGVSAAEWSVQLASDDVRDGAFALRLAHDCRRNALKGLAATAAPGLGAALLMAAGLAPNVTPPLAALAGAAFAAGRLRTRR
jgi:P-type Cu+ transporter